MNSQNKNQTKLLIKYLPVLFVALILVLFSQGNTLSSKSNFLSDSYVGAIVYPSVIDEVDKISTTDLIGRKYVLHFFATWCGYCMKEHVSFLQMEKKLPIYAIGWKDDSDELKELLRDGNPYTNVGFDEYGSLSRKLGIRVIPQTFVIDEKGKIIFHRVGQFDPNELLKFFK
jgi:cytochrome c biogenesis protein CcmG/thiol:disulfide interchange protein DsbE